jgi:hypothetical protein
MTVIELQRELNKALHSLMKQDFNLLDCDVILKDGDNYQSHISSIVTAQNYMHKGKSIIIILGKDYE